jgi:ABC-2 type transport system permease protein
MMHNIGTVLRFEVSRTLKKPTFWISVLSVPIFTAVLFAIIFFSNKATEEATQKNEQQKFSFVVRDQSGYLAAESIEKAGGTLTNDTALAIKNVKNGTVDAFIDYPKDLAKEEVKVYDKNDGLIKNDKYTAAAEALIVGAVGNTIDPATVVVIKNGVKTKQINYENGKEANIIGRMIMPAVFLVIFYAVIILLTNQMLTSTTEEKENRVTEMILTSIKSRSLILGKIFALLILGVIQIATIVLPIILAYVFAREALNIPDLSSFIDSIQFEFWPILIGACLLAGSLLLFTGLNVAIGAAMPTAKEANSFFGFIILFMVAPFWITSLIMTNPSTTVVQIFSYFPLTAPVTLMLRNIFGNLSPIEGIAGAIVVAVASVIMMALAIRIFRFGTLEYSNRIALAAIFKRKEKGTS